MKPIILASGSPRRRQLLEQAHISFEVQAADVDETPPAGMACAEVPGFLAQKKARAVADRFPEAIILAADTIVVLDDQIIGKPSDAAEARQMLHCLSGRSHTVITGVCLLSGTDETVFSKKTSVRFRTLTSEQIAFYVETYKPFDKAGAYAIQEYIGMVGIEAITGDYYNVMGLPIGDVVALLGGSVS